mmetsp:Transcript_13903/g.21108  ORF Transcript_13903/g.21108 Transcript_13903/m.21108 type:complete len:130 (+) Transcript_13903:1-390(+)
MRARKHHDTNKQSYTILWIITDGKIDDMDQSIEEICQGAHEALSIVFIGIGDVDCFKMYRLDGDSQTLSDSEGTKCCRDIVQFVPFQQFSRSAGLLEAETLSEIPFQMVRYFIRNKIFPSPLRPKHHRR